MEVTVENTSKGTPFQIKGIDLQKTDEGEPVSEAGVTYPTAGTNSIIALHVDLDAPQCVARQIVYGDGHNSIEPSPYFERNVIDVAPGELVTLRIMGVAKERAYSWTPLLLVDTPSWKRARSIPVPIEIQRTSAVPREGYATELIWNWFAGPRDADFTPPMT